MPTSGLMRVVAVQGYNYLHPAVDYAGVGVLAFLPRIPILEDSYGLAGDPIAASCDCAC